MTVIINNDGFACVVLRIMADEGAWPLSAQYIWEGMRQGLQKNIKDSRYYFPKA